MQRLLTIPEASGRMFTPCSRFGHDFNPFQRVPAG